MGNDAKRKVLEMLVDKNITIDDALELLEALENDSEEIDKKKSFTFGNHDNDAFQFNDAFINIDDDMKVNLKDLKQTLKDVKTKVNDIKKHSTIIIEKKRK
jgi:DUF4097 and DUF4098 domain-containing protein YvlB